MLRCIVTASKLWCWFQQWRYAFRTLMKCVGKVIIYHPPKFQSSTIIWHCCSLSWMLWGAWIHCWKLRWSCQIKTGEACITSGCCEKLVWIDCRAQPDLQASLLWFENCIPSWHARCIASAHAEMASTPRFLAAIQWVLMLPISETKSHPRLMSGLVGASISSSLRTRSPQDMHVA
jgi:hypothetical protein